MRNSLISDSEKPFLEHLRDLRRTLIKISGALGLGMLIAAPLAPHVMEILKWPLIHAGKDPSDFLIQLKVAGGFAVAIRVIFWSGLMFALPVIVYYVCAFVFPGLLEKERKAVVHSFAFAALLFIFGVLLGYRLSVAVALNFMFNIGEWIGVSLDHIYVTDYISFVLKLLLGFGLAFELPVLLFGLGYLGVFNVAQLQAKRRHIAVGILTLSMLLTPQDPFTMLIMAVPLYGLYEICMLLIGVVERRRASIE